MKKLSRTMADILDLYACNTALERADTQDERLLRAVASTDTSEARLGHVQRAMLKDVTRIVAYSHMSGGFVDGHEPRRAVTELMDHGRTSVCAYSRHIAGVRRAVTPDVFYCKGLPAALHHAEFSRTWFSDEDAALRIGAESVNDVRIGHITGTVAMWIASAGDATGGKWLNDNINAIMEVTQPCRLWVWIEPGTDMRILEMVLNMEDAKEIRTFADAEPCPKPAGRIVMVENKLAKENWPRPAEQQPSVCGRDDVCTERWFKAFHWYDSTHMKRTDDGFFGQDHVFGDDRHLYVALEHSDSLAGILGILPNGLARILRRMPAGMHESNARMHNRRTGSMLKEIRRELIKAATDIATDWIKRSNLWIRLFW